jgi:hypothetical protein
MNRRFAALYLSVSFLLLGMLFAGSAPVAAQAITATLEGKVTDASGGVIAGATVTATNTSTKISRSAHTSELGDYRIPLLPAGEYEVAVEQQGFQKEARKITLLVAQLATLDFTLQVGTLAQEVRVEAGATVLERTRTEVSSVIVEQQIDALPVNGRQFIDFALLAPGVTIGETTSGSTDVIVEPVTKLSFAGQNINYNLVLVDGADNISTASGLQKSTPSQEAVQEFRVINTQYSAEAGRAVGGIVNIITKSGTNDWHGSGYWFIRNDSLDADSILSSPDPDTCNTPGVISSGGCEPLNNLEQNQYGFTLGGPVRKDKTFIFGNYEGQRRRESPFYNSAVLANIDAINMAKTTLFGTLPAGAPGTLPAENLKVTRTADYNQFLVKVDTALTDKHYLFVRYFFNDAEYLNVSPLNDGFEVPSGFKDNFITDNSIVGSLTSNFSPSWFNDLRLQFAHRDFDFPTVTTQPHLEVANLFTIGVNRGNPDFYREPRFEISDSVTWTRGKHTVQFGGNFNWVRTTESFPLFYPFEATFASVADLLAGNPAVIFYQKNDASIATTPGSPGFDEPTIDPSIYQGRQISNAVANQAKGVLTHNYAGFFVQDKWRATDRLTMNFGLRYEWETWGNNVLDSDLDNLDPRFGFAYNFGTRHHVVLRGGAGLFHGIVPYRLLACQRPSCGGVRGELPGREDIQNDLDAATRLLVYVPVPINPTTANDALIGLLNGTYPICSTGTCLGTNFNPGADPITGLELDATIVRFTQRHQAPYGIQASLALEMELWKDYGFSLSWLHVRGNELGSFFNINQPPPSCGGSGQPACPTRFNSSGDSAPKDIFFVGGFPLTDPMFTGFPGQVDPSFALYFEADSLWSSNYHGMLLNFQKRPGQYLGFGASYTWSKSIDNGPNPSFVLIPQNTGRFDLERTISSDHVAHRFVGNATLFGPKDYHPILNNFEFGMILSIQGPHFFTKFAGFDTNGDIFPVNDRVGIEHRNTFKGDNLRSFDLRISRAFDFGERGKLQLIGEAFNLFNTLNIRFFNTVYGAEDFCPFNAAAAGCAGGPFPNLEGSPNPAYGTPRAINNPRQVQFAVRYSF